jgi:hypothetical protein
MFSITPRLRYLDISRYNSAKSKTVRMSSFWRVHFGSAWIRTRLLLLLHICPRQTRESGASSCMACKRLCRRSHRLSADDREQEMCHSIQCVVFLRFSLEEIDICHLVADMLTSCHSSLLHIAVRISSALLAWSQRWMCLVTLGPHGGPCSSRKGRSARIYVICAGVCLPLGRHLVHPQGDRPPYVSPRVPRS